MAFSGGYGSLSDVVYQELDKLNMVSVTERWVNVTNRWTANCAAKTLTQVTAGGHCTQQKFVITQPCDQIKLEYGTCGATIVDPFQIVKVAVVYNGDIYPMYFDGERAITVPVDTVQWTDPLDLTLAPGDVIYVRTQATAGGTDKLMPAISLDDAGRTGSLTFNTNDPVDSTAVGYLWGWGSDITADHLGPQTIKGRALGAYKPQVMVFGDSITSVISADNHNWITHMLANNGIPFNVTGIGGQKFSTFEADSKRFADQMQDADIIVCALGRNDVDDAEVTTLELFQERARAFWALLPKRAKIYQTTIAPYTNADNNADGAASGMFTLANLKLINDWIRTCPAPLAGVIDIADMMMSARDSNRWKTGYSADGIHPNATVGVPGIQGQIKNYGALFGIEPKKEARYVQLLRDREIFITTAVNDTYVGTGVALQIPGPCVLKGLLITASAPYGTSGGAKTINYAVGTAKNADADLADATDIDIMVASGEQTAASVHGDAASDHAATYFTMDGVGKYLSAPQNTIYLNYIGKSATGGTTAGQVVGLFNVWAKIEPLP